MNWPCLTQRSTRGLALAASILFSLTGCGGGGGSSAADDPDTPPAPPPVLTAPAITQQPQALRRFAGAPALLAAAATGSPPLAYQWFRDGQPIAAATEATYDLGGAQPADAGTYHVVVRNAAGEAASQAAQVTVSSTAPQVAASDFHALALMADGSVFAWGSNEHGQLGDGSTNGSPRPVAVLSAPGTPLRDIVAVAAADDRSLALHRDGTVLAWGNDQLLPAAVAADASGAPLTGVVAIAAGPGHAVALREDGTLVAWGIHDFIGNPLSFGIYPAPVVDGAGEPVSGVVAISAGVSHSLAVRADGSVLAWGFNLYGELGDGTRDRRIVAAPVMDGTGAALTGIRAVSAGEYASYAVRTDGAVVAWGDGVLGQMGDGTVARSPFPVRVVNAAGSPLAGMHAVRAGWDHALALGADGCALSWGSNVWYQLGQPPSPEATYRSHADAVQAEAGAPLCGTLALASGSRYTNFAISDTGQLLAWGRNELGRLGDGTTEHRPLPVPVLLPGAMF
jgi:alpha-tubulin suppressor-like RCC1 family protein